MWTPTTEKEPETYGWYMVTTNKGTIRRCRFTENGWMQGIRAGTRVVAWQAEPKPYIDREKAREEIQKLQSRISGLDDTIRACERAKTKYNEDIRSLKESLGWTD